MQILRVVLLVGLLGNIQAEQGKETVQIIDHPRKPIIRLKFECRISKQTFESRHHQMFGFAKKKLRKLP